MVQKIEIEGLTAEQLFSKFDTLEKQINDLKSVTTPPTKLLTRDEVSQLLGVTIISTYNWTKKGILTAYKIGNQVRYKENEVLQALQSIKSK